MIHTYAVDIYQKQDNVGVTIINHPFGIGLYQLSIAMTGGWFIIVIPTLDR